MKKITNKLLALLLAFSIGATPAFATFNPANPNGNATSANSAPVTQSAPTAVLSAATLVRPANTTQYSVGQTFGGTTTGNSILSWVVAPANGIPVTITKALMQTQTSGGAGVTTTNGNFILYLFNQSPTLASADGVALSVATANFCGAMYGSLTQVGTDWSIGEMVPMLAPAVVCTPAGGSSTIYGVMQANAAFTPTSAEVTQVKLVAP